MIYEDDRLKEIRDQYEYNRRTGGGQVLLTMSQLRLLLDIIDGPVHVSSDESVSELANDPQSTG
jgi:hypothetical protein